MTKVALDTVVVAAIIDRHDKWHQRAYAILEKLKATAVEVVLLDPVLNEVISVLARRLHEQGRSQQVPMLLETIEQVLPSEQIVWVSSQTQRLFPRILAIVKGYQGQLNFHDALIALACQELGIEYIVSFDQDFDLISWLTRIDDPVHVPK